MRQRESAAGQAPARKATTRQWERPAGAPVGVNVLNGGIILALMSVPIIVSIGEDALKAVPDSYREAAIALGATVTAVRRAGPGTYLIATSDGRVIPLEMKYNVTFENGTRRVQAGPAFDALAAFWADGTEPEKFIQTESRLYTQADDPAGEYERRKDLGY